MKSSRTGRSVSTRPKLPKVSEEMKAWSAALVTEVGGWSQVTTHSFFGFTALYRKERIFALLPHTRGMGTANALAFKLHAPQPRILARLRRDERIGATEMKKSRWLTFELDIAADLRDAVNWLGEAYEGADGESRSRG